ncbi:hypothetical protein BX600DRAFT_32866 [Xylariales sp. PMI_506]|nr:hypothetical protein BX600DRAFT_32866 [Xylariales sp. PMI_506]
MSTSGPPYMTNTALVGGVPTVPIDIPISACLIFAYLCLAVTHMTIFQLNKRREHKFIFSGLLFGLSMARTTALVIRIVWATRPTNTRIAIAANILTQAGVILLFIANLFFAQRIVRAYHPTFGWHRASRIVFRFMVFSVIGCLIMVITCTVHMLYTLDLTARARDRDVQLFAGTYLAFLSFFPAPAVTLAALIPRSGDRRVEKFGQGRFRTKVRLLLFTSLLLTVGAGFRIGTNFNPAPQDAPRWYDHRACYYVLNYGIEIIVSALYAAVRFDRRFHIPNGAKGPGDYAAAAGATKSFAVNTEAEAFGPTDDDDESGEDPAVAGSRKPTEADWEDRFSREQKAGEASDSV